MVRGFQGSEEQVEADCLLGYRVGEKEPDVRTVQVGGHVRRKTEHHPSDRPA